MEINFVKETKLIVSTSQQIPLSKKVYYTSIWLKIATTPLANTAPNHRKLPWNLV